MLEGPQPGTIFWFAHTLCLNYVTETFLLVSSSVKSKQLLCFVHGQGQKREKLPVKNFVGFPNHSPLLTMSKTLCCNINVNVIKFALIAVA